MTQDPIQPLADAGRRVLRTVRYLATPPVPDQPLESYESLLRDPVVTMSGICNELLERLATAPVAAKPEDLPHEPWSRFVPDSNASPTSPTLSSAGAVATRFPVNGHYQAADSWREGPATERPDRQEPGSGGPSAFEKSRRTIDDPTPSRDEPGSPEPGAAAASEPGGAARQADSPALPPLRAAIIGPDSYPEALRTASRSSRSRGIPRQAERPPTGEHPVESDSESSRAEHSSETQPPVQQEWLNTRRPDNWRPEIPSDGTARASDVPAQAEKGPTRGAGEVDPLFPPTGSRLTGSTERLAAMLRAHVAPPEPAAGTAGTEGQEISSSRRGDDERGAAGTVDEPAQARPDSQAGIEEIMERLADELETEFVRTYGSSGG